MEPEEKPVLFLWFPNSTVLQGNPAYCRNVLAWEEVGKWKTVTCK